jgi:UDPglucose 6-dehydrogenase
MMTQAMEDDFLRFTTSISEGVRASEVVFIAVGTPAAPDGSSDLRMVRAVAEQIGRNIDKPTVVVNKSTVPVGTGEMVETIIAEQGVPDELYDVVSNPEFLREGTAISDTLHPDRIVIGSRHSKAANKLVELYGCLNAPMIVTDLNSAELIKYASNSFLAMKISFINAISRLCEECGADIGDVARGVGADSRIGRQFLNAGLGWGGSCFPKDVTGLIATSEKLGYDFDLLKEVVRINDEQIVRFVDRIESSLGGLEGKVVGLLGLAFKPDTDDIRDAKSLIIIERLLARGAEVRAYDPVAADKVKALFPQVTYVDRSYDAAVGADCLVTVTEWREFTDLDLSRIAQSMRGRKLFDGRRIYSLEKATKAGLEYYAIGKASANPARLL